jgi:hypothetical protein
MFPPTESARRTDRDGTTSFRFNVTVIKGPRARRSSILATYKRGSNGSDLGDRLDLAHAPAERQAAARDRTLAAAAGGRAGNSRVGWKAAVETARSAADPRASLARGIGNHFDPDAGPVEAITPNGILRSRTFVSGAGRRVCDKIAFIDVDPAILRMEQNRPFRNLKPEGLRA